MDPRKIAVLGTGGTVAGTASTPRDHVGYRSAQIGIDQLLAAIPALRGVPLATEQVAQVDSKDMSFEVWRDLALRCDHWLNDDSVAGVVVTHGTDTLEETAYFLQEVLQPAKPVVITCAMRPATALMPDGPQNIVDAVATALAPGARGVVAVCAGTIHAAADVTKVHTYRLDAFTSGDAGPVGYVEEGRVRLVRDWPRPAGGGLLPKVRAVSAWPRVEIITSHAGASGSLVQALVAQGVQGIVVAGTGNGTVHREVEAALLEAAAAGVQVVRSTRCVAGHVIAHPFDRLRAHPASPVKARIALMLELLA